MITKQLSLYDILYFIIIDVYIFTYFNCND